MSTIDYLLSHRELLTESETLELLASLEAKDASLARVAVESEAARLRSSFAAFFQAAWPHVETGPLVMGFHLELMCRHLEELHRGVLFRDLLINIPPGCSKSVCVSVIWPAWVWANDPTATFMGISYSQRIAERDAMKTRSLILSPWYQSLFGYTIGMGDLDQRKMYYLRSGGWRLSTTPLGAATGEHPKYIIVDDPINAANAESVSRRPAVNEWWDSTMSTRGVSLGRRVVGVMQRFHEADWSGHILESEPEMAHVCLPMRFESGRMRDIGLGTDVRTEPGELLDPVRFPEPVVAKLERQLGIYGAAGQLQQRPTAKAGALFKIDEINFVDLEAVPLSKIIRFKRAWDKAGTKNAGDETAGPVGGITGGDRPKLFVFDVVCGRWSTDDVEDQMKLWAKLDERRFGFSKFETVFEMEPGASGIQAATETKRRLRGHRVRAVRPTGNKVVRAEPLANAIAAGEVYFVNGPWVSATVDQMRNFPKGKHDDRVDGLSLLYIELVRGSLFEEDIEDVGSALVKCKNPACNRMANEETDYCCDSCREAEYHGVMIGEAGHCPECAYRHSQLYAAGDWEPDA
jgi:predicted phage terminase large subunit-like protein